MITFVTQVIQTRHDAELLGKYGGNAITTLPMPEVFHARFPKSFTMVMSLILTKTNQQSK